MNKQLVHVAQCSEHVMGRRGRILLLRRPWASPLVGCWRCWLWYLVAQALEADGAPWPPAPLSLNRGCAVSDALVPSSLRARLLKGT